METQILLDNDIDMIIAAERNSDIQSLAHDIMDINEIMSTLSQMVYGQRSGVDNIEASIEKSVGNVEEGTKNLEKAEEYQVKNRSLIRDIAIVAGGFGVGTLGLIAGPIVGLVTIAASTTLSGSLVYAVRKKKNL